MKLVLSDTSNSHIAQLMSKLPQSVLLSGEEGVGLYAIAKYLAGEELAAIIQPTNAKGEIDNSGGTISVERIRQLYDQTRSIAKQRQIIIIDNADFMSKAAQNAFLKLLEEPSQYTHFILTAHSIDALLPTILSRVQKIVIQPISHEQTLSYITQLGVTDATMQRQLLFIASGKPAELSRLIDSPAYFAECAEITTDARDFLQATEYQKLRIIQKYASDRQKAIRLLDSALHIARRSLSTKPQITLIQHLERLLETRERILGNQNIRLQLTRLVI